MSTPYKTYAEVPYYRQQWFFWIMYFIPVLSIIAICLLLFGDIYYEKKGEVKSFGIANRVVAGIIAVLYVYGLASAAIGAVI